MTYKDPEKRVEYQLAYYKANRDRLLEKKRLEYRGANREKKLEKKRAYWAANREKLLETMRAGHQRKVEFYEHGLVELFNARPYPGMDNGPGEGAEAPTKGSGDHVD